jgi:cytochrome c peroxidase
VFGTGVTAEGVAKAIAAFQRTLLSGNSAYDRYRAGHANALTAAARRGLALFEGKASCVNATMASISPTRDSITRASARAATVRTLDDTKYPGEM